MDNTNIPPQGPNSNPTFPRTTPPSSGVSPSVPVNPLYSKSSQPGVATNKLPELTPPTPKRKFPSGILLGAIAFVVLSLFIFVIWRLIAQGQKKTSVVELAWWGLWENESAYSEVIQAYESENPGVKVKYIKQAPQDYRERLTSSLAKETGPDIFMFHNSWVPMFSKELDNLPASFMSAADFAQTYYPTVSIDLANKTGIVGVPLGYEALTLFINEDIFKNEGVEPPTTWDDLRQKAKQLTKVENGVITRAGVALGRTENVDHWPEVLALMMVQNGVDMTQPQGKLTEDAILFFTIFSRVDGVWDATLPPSTAAFASGKLAMYFGPSWRAFNIKEQNPDLNFRTIPLPQLAKEDPNEPGISYATYWANGVWVRGKNKDKAWSFLKYISTKSSLEKIYKEESTERGFGEAYPRIDMGNSILEHPVLGSIIKLAPISQSWFLADRTFDGPTGINTQLKKYYEDAINAVNKGDNVTKTTEPLVQGVKQVLSQYGLVK